MSAAPMVQHKGHAACPECASWNPPLANACAVCGYVGGPTAEQRIAALERSVAGLESLRPVWAYGFGPDGAHQQTCAAALAAVWKLLGVTDQTACMQKLRALVEAATP